MRRIVLEMSAVFATLLVLSLASAGDSSLAPWPGRVVGIVDGDSIDVMHNDRAERIRIVEIDCPESGQAFGQAAKRKTSGLAFGKTVTIQPRTHDRYGRVVADVLLPDGRSLGAVLVDTGLAWVYRKYSDNPLLRKLEDRARGERRGLWADAAPVPPWEFRKNQAIRAQDESKPASEPPPDTVYVSPSGSAFHRHDCAALHGHEIPIPLEEAKKNHTPCRRCRPLG